MSWGDLKFWSWKVFDGYSWDNTATLLAALIAVTGVVVGFGVTAAHSRRERRAQTYADAIKAVSEYLEGPYRVARCHDNDAERAAISTDISAVQARIDAHKVLLRLHANGRVASTYDAYVAAARVEAGRQMTAEWNLRPAKKHSDMNVRRRLDRSTSSAAKVDLLNAMARDLGRRWFKPWTWFGRCLFDGPISDTICRPTTRLSRLEGGPAQRKDRDGPDAGVADSAATPLQEGR